MQLKELSEASGTTPATIKFYLREGLLPPGEAVHATRASYSRKHMKRLQLIHALRRIVGLSIDQVRSIVRLSDDGVPRLTLLAHVQRVVLGLGSDAADVARTEAADAVVRMRDWPDAQSDARDALDRHLAMMEGLGITLPLEVLDQYSRAVDAIAGLDLELTTAGNDTDDVILTAAIGMHMHSQLLLKLLALAQASHAIRRLHPGD
ncbi:MerR family transcriptional regulator [Arthrobacter sp. OV608]|uniref:MerR family transcriptional regulator n=1 Tax=Arthrobacter sp. OV608 TaxID=1882768 RepID=UPI0008C0E03B|nr:MerR family transcriptional regulator [Arthrobacter sp. OV608]SEP59137.1 MerR HTH family regulatory protein [Arthrobacter sp. OV608]